MGSRRSSTDTTWRGISATCTNGWCRSGIGTNTIRRVHIPKDKGSTGPKKLRARLESMGINGLPATSTIGEPLKKHQGSRARRPALRSARRRRSARVGLRGGRDAASLGWPGAGSTWRS
ncbi:hypothetical protein WMF20_39510 [Sorangium sp. So ce834]|uniref:hypothetical protein n=1 Tax=Sorangium sp. So ce834 TaxID=3133321 RepID=UPI003F63CADD